MPRDHFSPGKRRGPRSWSPGPINWPIAVITSSGETFTVTATRQRHTPLGVAVITDTEGNEWANTRLAPSVFRAHVEDES